MKQLWIDCDGVLADFDLAFERKFGHPKRNGVREPFVSQVWEDLEADKGFYRNLPVIPGATVFMDELSRFRPIILTGMPDGDWAYTQKREWGRENFPGVPMVMCMSKDKSEYCQRGDILVDDWLKYKDLWVAARGTFIYFNGDFNATRWTVERLMQDTPAIEIGGF